MELPRSRTPIHKQSAKFHLKCQEKVGDVGDTESWLTVSKLLAYTNGKVAVLQGIIDKTKDIVVKFGDIDEITEEYHAGFKLFEARLPNFIKFFCIFTCNDSFDQVLHQNYSSRPYICKGPNVNTKIACIIMPYCNLGSMNSYRWKKHQVDEFKNILKQICFALYIAYINTGFVHSDLHSGNVLLRHTKKKNITYEDVSLDIHNKYALIMDFQKPCAHDPVKFVKSLERIIYTSCTSDGSDLVFDCELRKIQQWFSRSNGIWNGVVSKELEDIIDSVSLRYVKSERPVKSFM